MKCNYLSFPVLVLLFCGFLILLNIETTSGQSPTPTDLLCTLRKFELLRLGTVGGTKANFKDLIGDELVEDMENGAKTNMNIDAISDKSHHSLLRGCMYNWNEPDIEKIDEMAEFDEKAFLSGIQVCYIGKSEQLKNTDNSPVEYFRVILDYTILAKDTTKKPGELLNSICEFAALLWNLQKQNPLRNTDMITLYKFRPLTQDPLDPINSDAIEVATQESEVNQHGWEYYTDLYDVDADKNIKYEHDININKDVHHSWSWTDQVPNRARAEMRAVFRRPDAPENHQDSEIISPYLFEPVDKHYNVICEKYEEPTYTHPEPILNED